MKNYDKTFLAISCYSGVRRINFLLSEVSSVLLFVFNCSSDFFSLPFCSVFYYSLIAAFYDNIFENYWLLRKDHALFLETEVYLYCLSFSLMDLSSISDDSKLSSLSSFILSCELLREVFYLFGLLLFGL